MLLTALNRRIKEFTGSEIFQIVIAVLSILIWMMPGDNLPWIFASFYILFSFFPLFASDGRAYMPLIFFVTITVSSKVSFVTLPVYLYVIGGTTFLSIVLFLILKKLPMKKGELSVPIGLLFVVFVISYLVNAVRDGRVERTGLLFLLSLFFVLLIYILFNTCLKREDTILYFARTVALLAVAVAIEIVLYQIRHGFLIGDLNFNLGWAYTSQTASTILCLSLPFFGMIIARRKFAWIFWLILVIYAIIVLSTDSGLLVLMAATIPLILLSFRSYGKAYPYISVCMICAIGLVFVVLMILNDEFSRRVIMALSSLNLGDPNSPRAELFERGINAFLESPAFGMSISVLSDIEHGTVMLCSNTVISTLAMGGAFGLFFFVIYEVVLYVTTFQKKAKEKWLFFLFLLIFETIGLVDNTLYNIFILLYALLAYSCYQISDRRDDVVVHDSYYRDYGQMMPLRYENY